MCCCGLKFAKFVLISLNLVFFLVGSAIFILGILAHFHQDVLLETLASIPPQLMADMTEAWNIPELLAEAAILLIVVGAFVLTVAFLGCCGAIKEVKCFLITYIVVVSIILILQLVTFILIIVKTQQANETVSMALQNSIKKHYLDSEGGLSFDENGKLQFAVRPIKLAWDGIQVVMSCCGAVNASDYLQSSFKGDYNFTTNGTTYEIKDAKVPLSCCQFVSKEEYEDGRAEVEKSQQRVAMPSNRLTKTRNAYTVVNGCLRDMDTRYIHEDGCYKTFLQLIEEYWQIFIGIIVGTMVVEVIGITCAITILRRRKEKGDPI